MSTKEAHTSKAKFVTELAEKINTSKTLMIVSVKGLPSKQFQDIKKSIREHALVKIAKKNIVLRAIKEVGKESILRLQEYISSDYALVVSDMEGYELAAILSKKKNPIFAKAGQTAPEDIEVKAGPTDLVPGPAISELGSLGLQVSVEEGKISIKQAKVVIKEGQTINENAASILQKLHIQPFTVGLEPVVIYDIESEKIYTDINIDSEEATEELRSAAGKALGFAQKIVYYCRDTIGYLLAKANNQGKALNELQEVEEVKEAETEKKIEKVEEKIKEDEAEIEKIEEEEDKIEEAEKKVEEEEEELKEEEKELEEDERILEDEKEIEEEEKEIQELKGKSSSESGDSGDKASSESGDSGDKASSESGDSGDKASSESGDSGGEGK